jgi:hypothetical protein
MSLYNHSPGGDIKEDGGLATASFFITEAVTKS